MTGSVVKPTTRFRRMADMVTQDLIVVPLVEAFLRAGKFPEVFSVVFRDEGKARKPDGWFHPSTHPLMPERMLWFYMRADPDDEDDWIPEQIEYENRMAIVMGTAVHGFVQMCMITAGILIKPKGTCVACGREHGTKKTQCDEFGASDPALRRRGHMDGILQISANDWGRGLFEFKTINPKAVFGLTHHNLEWLRTKKPDYYAQVQEYMDMTGMSKAVVVFAIIGFPWKLVEIEVPFDHALAYRTRTKYKRVLAMLEADEMPDPCCAPKSKEAKVCPARLQCPVGRMR